MGVRWPYGVCILSLCDESGGLTRMYLLLRDILHELAATSDIHFPDLSVPVSENVASDDRSLQEKLLDQMMSENFRGANFTRDDSPDSTMPSMPTPPDSHDSSDCPDIRLSHTIFDSKPDCATENEFWRTLYSATEYVPSICQLRVAWL